jgi:glucosamine--fructose-6-phosphate aminotransferase (isomerizing)
MTRASDSGVGHPVAGSASLRQTAMARECLEAPAHVAQQLERNAGLVDSLKHSLGADPVRTLLFCARGSSDNAALFAQYAAAPRLPLLTASLPPSLGSLYGTHADLSGALFVGISQSGRSPDLLACMIAAARAGAQTLAAVNALPAPLADLADTVMPLHAGRETSVAATKSFICSLSAMLHLISAWEAASDIRQALETLPEALDAATSLDWSDVQAVLNSACNLFVLGRGPGYAIAREAALKFKETCGIHAEAVSTAEVRHGPMALIGKGFPVLMFIQDDASREDSLTLARELVERGARVMTAGDGVPGALHLPTVPAEPVIMPLIQIQAFYGMVNKLSLARGLDPDRPPFLNKVTETL